jgi:undecaprenyl diphosphate synthase
MSRAHRREKGASGEKEPVDLEELPRDRLPAHVAFIMDGNGRWARRRGLLRLMGHEEGAKSLRRITRYCRRQGIREITFYALSAENYQRRPAQEIDYLMRLLQRYLVEERPELEENNIRLKAIGDVEPFPASVRRELDETRRRTAGHDGMILRLALNYGSRQEILDAVRALLAEAVTGRFGPKELASFDEAQLRAHLADPEMIDPDLVVRTAGEYRLSNFLLWQSSYSELWITERLWPDFDVPDLEEALQAFVARERKYGAVSSGAPRG